ncbi:MAG: HAD-IA family hydrolase, partial [Planctomycetes bacterium]|nr:HAD-IA family hydrolase [Planctomycetota bacterium]
PYFEVILGGDSPEARKPSPEGLLKICSLMALPPESTVMVGDHATDLETARRAGCRSVFCTFGIGSALDLSFDDSIDAFRELPDVLLRITKL